MRRLVNKKGEQINDIVSQMTEAVKVGRAPLFKVGSLNISTKE